MTMKMNSKKRMEKKTMSKKAEIKINSIIEIIKKTEKEIEEKVLNKIKDNSLNADFYKTLKAMAFEEIKSILKGDNENGEV